MLRCLSFNIWKNEGDYPRRMAAIGALLRELLPDVVALQECFVAPELGIDSASRLAGDLYHVTRYPARAKPRWHEGGWRDTRSDMALLTRCVPLDSGQVPLPCAERDGERGLLWADISSPAGTIRLACTHLTHLQGKEAERLRGQQAGAAMDALLAGDCDAAVLMGDFNAPSHAPALAPIFGHPLLCRQALQSAEALGGQSPANGAIDHVLPFARGGRLRLVRRSIAASPDPQGFPSDHPAILAEIEAA